MKRLKIGFVLSTTHTGSMGVVVRVQELAKALANLGAEIFIFSPFEEKAMQRTQGINVYRIGNRLSRLKYIDISYAILQNLLRHPFLCRNILLKKNVISKIIKSFERDIYSIVKKFDLDILEGEQEIASMACIMLKEKIGIPVVASLHNIWPEELRGSQVIHENSPSYLLLKDIENQIVSSADLTIVLSDDMKNHLIDYYDVPGEKLVVVPLGARPRVNEAVFYGSIKNVVHAGLMSYLDRVELFVESIPLINIKHPEISFYLTKKGERVKYIENVARRKNIKLNFFWYPNAHDFYEFLKTCHIGIVTSMHHPTRRFGYAMKFFDYLSCGIPVVANDIGGWTRIIEDKKVGILVKSTPQDFAEGITRLLENPDVVHKYGKNALQLIESKFNIDKIASYLYDQYLDCMS